MDVENNAAIIITYWGMLRAVYGGEISYRGKIQPCGALFA